MTQSVLFFPFPYDLLCWVLLGTWVSVVCVSWFVMWSTVEKGFSHQKFYHVYTRV